MPVVSTWMIRASLAYLLIVFLIGALMLIHKAVGLHPGIWTLLPLHVEMALFGWVIQFVLGTAYWIFPRLVKGPPRGDPWWGWVMLGSLNAGVLLVVFSSLGLLPAAAIFLGRLLELAGVLVFVKIHWRRVLTYRNR